MRLPEFSRTTTFRWTLVVSGAFALYTNSIGSGNTAMGSNALYSNRTAFANTAIGYGALFNNTGEDFALGSEGSVVVTAEG